MLIVATWLLVAAGVAIAGCQAFPISNHSYSVQSGFLARPNRHLQQGSLMHTAVPNCPPGYVDKTFGHAYWWDCAKRCPGPWPWSDKGCGCACVRPEELQAIQAQQAIGAARVSARGPTGGAGTIPAPDGEAAGPNEIQSGTYIAAASSVAVAGGSSAASSTGGTSSVASFSPSPQSVSLRAGAAPAPPPTAAPLSVGPATGQTWEEWLAAQPPDATTVPQWHNWLISTSTSAPASSPTESGPSDLSVGIISVCVIIVLAICLLAAMIYSKGRAAPRDLPVHEQKLLVRIMIRSIEQVAYVATRCMHKETRVEPMPEKTVDTVAHLADIVKAVETCKTLQHPVQLLRPPVQNFRVEKVQPVTQLEKIAISPDVSVVSRQQRERVMNGGWTSADGMNELPRRPSSRHSSVPGSARSSRRPSNRSSTSVPVSARSSHPSKRTPRPSVGSDWANVSPEKKRNRTPRPSFGSDVSTCSPSKPPSLASTGSKPPTPPSLD